MRIELAYTTDEKEMIRDWKNSLPINHERKFTYAFVENGKIDLDDCKLYDFKIITNDKYSLVINNSVSI